VGMKTLEEQLFVVQPDSPFETDDRTHVQRTFERKVNTG
jgi:hypothetical protein